MLCTGISPTPEAKVGRTCSSTYPGHTADYVVLASALPQEAKPSCSLLWWKDCALIQQAKRNALRVTPQSTPSFKRRNPQDEDPPRWGVPADSAVFGLFSSLLPTHSLCPWCPDYFMKLIPLFCTSMRGWVSWLRKPWNENQLGILVQTSLQHWMQLGRDQHYPSWCSLAPLSTEIGNLWGTHRAEGDRFTSHECNPETSTRQRSSTNASAK